MTHGAEGTLMVPAWKLPNGKLDPSAEFSEVAPTLPGQSISFGYDESETNPIKSISFPISRCEDDIKSGASFLTVSSGRLHVSYRFPTDRSTTSEVRRRVVESECLRLQALNTTYDPNSTEPQIELKVKVPMARFCLAFADARYEELYRLRCRMQLQHASPAMYLMLLSYTIYALCGTEIPGNGMFVLEWDSLPSTTYNLYWLFVHVCTLILLIMSLLLRTHRRWSRCTRWAFVWSECFAALYFGLIIWFQCLLGSHARISELLGHQPEDVLGTSARSDDDLLLHTALIVIYLTMYTQIRFKMLLFPGVSACLAYPISTLAATGGCGSLVRQVVNSVMLALVVVFVFVGQRQIEVTRRRNLLHEIECQSQMSMLRKEKDRAERHSGKLKDYKEMQLQMWAAVKKAKIHRGEGSSQKTKPDSGHAGRVRFAGQEEEPEAEPRTPNKSLDAALPEGVATDWAAVDRAVARIRDPAYSLREFHEDMVAAFPELALYTFAPHPEGGSGEGSGEELLSSGRSRLEEIARTFGALYAVYWLMRLDLDGKQGFCFGYKDDFTINPVPEVLSLNYVAEQKQGAMSAWEKQVHFYHSFPWGECHKLVTAAGLLEVGPGVHDAGAPRVNPGRLKAMLALTAIHDVMKNEALCPMVQAQHAPFRNYGAGQVIHDHDVALDYVLTFYGHVLPSYSGLEAGSKRLVRFTQGKMGFNNGWLVQGEAPPGALFHTFRQLICDGEANSADVAFYFMHWVTDLAGAEPTPLKGSEKFVQQFPMPVLTSFFRSFPYVWTLGFRTETQVFQEYLRARWTEVTALGRLPAGERSVALMRLALHLQGSEEHLHGALDALCPEDTETLVDELSRSGLPGQHYEGMSPRGGSPALLVYYGPAFLRRNGEALPVALSILAEVYRQGRRLFPLAQEVPGAEETPRAEDEPSSTGMESPVHSAAPPDAPVAHTASIRIEQLKDLAAKDIAQQAARLKGVSSFFLVLKSSLEAVVERRPMGAIRGMVDEGVTFAHLNFAP